MVAGMLGDTEFLTTFQYFFAHVLSVLRLLDTQFNEIKITGSVCKLIFFRATVFTLYFLFVWIFLRFKDLAVLYGLCGFRSYAYLSWV